MSLFGARVLYFSVLNAVPHLEGKCAEQIQFCLLLSGYGDGKITLTLFSKKSILPQLFQIYFYCILNVLCKFGHSPPTMFIVEALCYCFVCLDPNLIALAFKGLIQKKEGTDENTVPPLPLLKGCPIHIPK